MGILRGLMFAVGLTLIALMRKLSAPQDSVLGRVGDSGTFVDVGRHPDAQQVPGLLIFRPNGILFFANANRVRNRLRELVTQTRKPLRAVLVNLEASPEIDVTSLEMLEQLRGELQAAHIDLYFARVSDGVLDLLTRSGFLERLGNDRILSGVDIAVDAFLKASPPSTEQPISFAQTHA